MLGGLVISLSLVHVLLRFVSCGARSTLVKDFLPVIPIIVVSLLLLVWALAVYLFTDTLRLERLGQMAIGVGILLAVYLSVDNVYKVVRVMLVIILAVFVSAVFGVFVTYKGEPFLTIWLQLATVSERTLETILMRTGIAGLSPNELSLNYQLVVAIPLGFAMLLYCPLGQGKTSRIAYSVALYVLLASMVTIVVIGAARSAILGMLTGIVVITLLSMKRPRVLQRLLLVVSLVVAWQLVFFGAKAFITGSIESGDTLAARDFVHSTGVPPAIDEIAVGIEGIIGGSDCLAINHALRGLPPGEYAIQVRARNAYGYGDEREVMVTTGESKGVVLTWCVLDSSTGTTGYQVRLRPADATQWWAWREVKRKNILSLSDPSAQSRRHLATTALRYSLDHPFGTGRYFPNASHLSEGLNHWMAGRILSNTPHNQFLVILVYYGFPGLVFLILFYVLIVRSLRCSARLGMRLRDEIFYFPTVAVTGALVAYLVNSLFNNMGPFVGDWFHFFLIGLVFSIQRVVAAHKLTSKLP